MNANLEDIPVPEVLHVQMLLAATYANVLRGSLEMENHAEVRGLIPPLSLPCNSVVQNGTYQAQN